MFSLSSLGDPQIFEDGEILKKNRTNKLKIQVSTHWTLFRIKMGLISSQDTCMYLVMESINYVFTMNETL